MEAHNGIERRRSFIRLGGDVAKCWRRRKEREIEQGRREGEREKDWTSSQDTGKNATPYTTQSAF